MKGEGRDASSRKERRALSDVTAKYRENEEDSARVDRDVCEGGRRTHESEGEKDHIQPLARFPPKTSKIGIA